MNKNDFYKQLMSEYTFDAEKIRINAKKGRFARQKISPMAIGLTASVAAATVACGTLAITMLDNKNGVDLVDTGNKTLSDLSAAERVKIAIEQQNKDQNNEEIKDVLVTFTTPVAPAQAEAILSAHIEGNAFVKAVYLADDSLIMGSEQVAAVFKGDQQIKAVAVQCAASIKAKLQSDSNVFLAEDWSEMDFSTSVPINPEDVETVDVQLPDNITDNVVTPDVTPDILTPGGDISDSTSGGTEPQLPTESDETPESAETVEDTDPTETIEPTESTEIVDPSETDDPVVSEPVVPDIPEQPVTPVVPAPQLPDGVVLPVNPDKVLYETGHIGAKEAFFLNNNYYFVASDNEAALYEYHNSKETLMAYVECNDPVVHWVAENGNRLLVSGSDENGMRNKMWLLDANSSAFIDLYIEDMVMSGTLVEAGYHAETGTLVLNITEDGEYYVGALKYVPLDGEPDYIGIPFDAKAKTSLLGFNGSTLYLAVSDGTLTQIHAIDIYTNASRIVKTFDNNPRISTNLAFTQSIISPSASAVTGNVQIFDSVSETFITTEYFSEKLNFGASRSSFSVNGKVYTISNGAIVSSGGLKTTAPIDYKKSFSSYYMAVISDGYVKIYDSYYSIENKNGNLNFTQITSSGDSDFRAALEGAIGLSNALAGESCKEAGISTYTKLVDSLSVYYSENAVNQLIRLCSISNIGRFDYFSGGLKAISAREAKLVINSSDDSSASGIVYINAGTFCGKTAYRSINISFVREDGVWKVNSIIR